jgi:uncharacterized Zn-binding protein involved in type VI secretion
MGTPAAVMGDRITGMCAIHQVPNPASGVPQPSPAPLPFSAPLTLGLATRTTIAGKPAALMGSSGYNTPPHVGLHATDPFLTPTLQEGRVLAGSPTVTIEGKPAARTGSQCLCCATPGTLTGTAATVMIA